MTLDPQINRNKLWGIGLFCLLSAFLFAAINLRAVNTYLEDDLVWFLPLIKDLNENLSLKGLWQAFHMHELTFFDGVYFSFMLKAFGLNMAYYVYTLFAFHLLNAFLLYILLRYRIQLKPATSFFAGIIYLTYYGHFHAYLWPMAAHHLLCVSFILLILILYLKTERLVDEGKPFGRMYALTMAVCTLASFLRLSIIILPIMLTVHILYIQKDLRNVSARFLRWAPVLAILASYQLALFGLAEGHGNVLKKFIKPLQEGLAEKGAEGIIIILACEIAGLFLMWGLLRFIEFSKKELVLASLLEKAQYLLMLFPHLFVVALFVWGGSYFSANHVDPLLRWHAMLTPEPAGLYWLFVILVWGLFITFIRFSKNVNRHLVVFGVWYICLQPFLLSADEGAFSRYIIYYSPFFSCLLGLVFFEWMPARIALLKKPAGRKSVVAFIIIIAVINIYSIHLRLQKTFLGDYYWSYDYIKFANLIKEDLDRRPTPKVIKSICLENVTPVVLWGQWKRSFLSWTSVDDWAAYRMVFQKVLGDKIMVQANDCQGTDAIYTVTDKTLIRDGMVLVEPFYHYMSLGLLALSREDYPQAKVYLGEAVDAKPFSFNMLLSLNYFDRGRHPAAIGPVAEKLREFYYIYYSDDPKRLFIENLVQNEVLDYGISLLLYGYVQNKLDASKGEETLELARRVISQQEVLSFPVSQLLTEDQFKTLAPFIAALDETMIPKNNPPSTLSEYYKGFVLYWFPARYLAVTQSADQFDIAAFKRGVYQPSFIGQRRHEIKALIDAAPANDSLPEAKRLEFVEEYKGFIIKEDEEHHFRAKQIAGNKNDVFRALSLAEIQMIIDAYLKL